MKSSDDSGSMQFEENGERIDDLKLVLSRVSHAATMWDPDGISVRFMNSNLPGSLLDNVRGEQQIDQVSLVYHEPSPSIVLTMSPDHAPSQVLGSHPHGS